MASFAPKYLLSVKTREDEYEVGTKLLYEIIWVAGEPRDCSDDKIVCYEFMKSEFVD